MSAQGTLYVKVKPNWKTSGGLSATTIVAHHDAGNWQEAKSPRQGWTNWALGRSDRPSQRTPSVAKEGGVGKTRFSTLRIGRGM